MCTSFSILKTKISIKTWWTPSISWAFMHMDASVCSWYQRARDPMIGSSISSDPTGATFTDEIRTTNKDTHSNIHSTGEFHTDTLNNFVSSMKRTWLMALYCGLAFSMRSVIILAVSD
eukprot:108363_1